MLNLHFDPAATVLWSDALQHKNCIELNDQVGLVGAVQPYDLVSSLFNSSIQMPFLLLIEWTKLGAMFQNMGLKLFPISDLMQIAHPARDAVWLNLFLYGLVL